MCSVTLPRPRVSAPCAGVCWLFGVWLVLRWCGGWGALESGWGCGGQCEPAPAARVVGRRFGNCGRLGGAAGFVGVPWHCGGWCSLAADSVLKRWSYQVEQVSTTHIDISLGEHDLHWGNVTVTPEPGGNPSVYLRAYLTRDEYVYALQASAVSEPQCPLTLVIGGQTFSLEGTPRIKHDGNDRFADCRVQVSSETLTAISQALARQELTGT